MKIRKILSVVLAGIMLLSSANLAVFAEETASDSVVATIGDANFATLDEAFAAAKEGDTIQLSEGEFEFGKIVLPAELVNVTIKGAADKRTIIKNSNIASANEDRINYTDITFDGIVFENSYIALKGKGTGDAVFKNWTVTNCEFKNIVTPDKNTPAFAYSQKAVIEKMTGFTFTNNVIDGVSGGLNTGMRLGSAAGKIVISDNVIKNTAWNAIQITNVDENPIVDSDEPPTIEITNNEISGVGADEGMVNLNSVRCEVTFTGNTLTRRIEKHPYLCYVKTKLNMSDNTWIDENGNPVDDEAAKEGIYIVEKDAELEKAINRLKEFGIAKGVTEKDFGENESVTREQMAAFVYRFMHKGESVEDGANDTTFTDLEAPIFFAMISWANSEGIIKGVSETSFEPKGGITLQDCYTMVLRALGYEENEELTYPDGYIALAKELRISDNVKETENTAELTRGDVAIILYNALFADMKDGENAAVKIYERHPLDGKKVLFIGNSMTFHGNAVFRKSRTVLELKSRRNDTGYFYQLAKTNGAEPQVTNWTWGGHALMDIFAKECTSARECKGLDHLSNFTDYDYDYVFLQEGTKQNAEVVKEVAEKFKAVNPDVEIFVLMPSYHYFADKDTSDYIAELKEMGFTVIDWGRMVVDIANGEVEVTGAIEKYNKNSFVVALDETDGHHPNVLTGYITALMSYCAASGESAVGQDYAFCSDKKIAPEFDFDAYEKTYYVYDNATTNFPEIFASESDMKGIQQLADEYLVK